jgi:phosphate-selective porin
MKLKLLSLLLVLGLAGTTAAQANNKELVDLLITNGTITREQADALLKKSGPSVTAGTGLVKNIRINGRLQVQHDYLSYENKGGSNPSDVNQVLLRRVRLGARADIGEGMTGFINAEFGNDDARLSDAILSYKAGSVGTLTVGYQKVNFGAEENTSSASIKTVERSLASRYFNESNNGRRLGFGSRHVGLYWNGKLEGVDGLGYGVAITNTQGGGSFSGSGLNNSLAYWANVYYSSPFENGDLTFGVNFGYNPEGNSKDATDTAKSQTNHIIGYNPYVKLNYGDFSLLAEYIGGEVKNGSRDGKSNAAPWGFHIIPSYKISDAFEVVLRYSHIDTDGRGINPSDGFRNLNSVGTFNKGNAYYAGFNWYIRGNNVKLSSGYEYGDFSDRHVSGNNFSGSNKGESHTIRTRLQFLF